MTQSSPFSKPLHHPVRSLVLVFSFWKLLLLLIAILSPGPGYDTSTSLAQPVHASNVLERAIAHLCNKLTRWDAIYFAKVANRGYLYEQEWAWGWGFTRVIGWCANGLQRFGLQHLGLHRPDYLESLVGVVIAHTTHLISTLVLHSLTLKVFAGENQSKIAFLSACLHIFSPAGLFLSAPYAESPFAMLSFLGYYMFAQSTKSVGSKSDIGFIGAGVVFAISTTFRSNGLLNGFLFVEAAVRTLFSLQESLSFARLQRLVAIGIGGCCIGAGFVLPQVIAYQQFCVDSSRVWCQRSIPSVYTFVQSYYWNVGFLRYWTIPNLPLFLIAVPMLTVLSISGRWAFRTSRNDPNSKATIAKSQVAQIPTTGVLSTDIVKTMAVIQLVLTMAAITTYHVQIITRISSAYPVWYWFLATCLSDKSNMRDIGTNQQAKGAIRWIVMYAVIQGGLYASFLPPA